MFPKGDVVATISDAVFIIIQTLYRAGEDRRYERGRRNVEAEQREGREKGRKGIENWSKGGGGGRGEE